MRRKKARRSRRRPASMTEPVIITKAIVLDGCAGVIIDGNGKGTVVTLTADRATLKNLTIRNSGRLHNQVMPGCASRAASMSSGMCESRMRCSASTCTRPTTTCCAAITSPPTTCRLELRGDSIRLWYSNANTLEDNVIEDARDFVGLVFPTTGSSGTTGSGAAATASISCMRTANQVTDNEIADCVVGVFLMYSNDIEVRHNRILRAWGASGMGIGFKETSGAVHDRQCHHRQCDRHLSRSVAMGPRGDQSNSRTTRIAYNGIGVEFHTDWKGNNFRDNTFISNFTQLSVRGRRHGTSAKAGRATTGMTSPGFDQDGDGKGDSPYRDLHLCRPAVDGTALRLVFPRRTGAGSARFCRAAGTVLANRACW